MTRQRRLLLLAGPLVLLTVGGWTAWRHARQARLDAALVAAVESDDAGRVRRLVAAGASPNATVAEVPDPPIDLVDRIARWVLPDPNRQRYPAVTCALADGHWAAADALVRLNANLDDRVSAGTPLWYAVASDGPVSVVQLLLDHGADPNRLSCNTLPPSALGAAASGQDGRRALTITRLLLERGADPSRDPLALGYAASQDRAEIVRVLLRYGADPTQRADLHGYGSVSPAALAQEPALRRLLRRAEADWRRKHPGRTRPPGGEKRG